jgi:hypothetical protein
MTHRQKLFTILPLGALLLLAGGVLGGYASLAGAESTSTPTGEARPLLGHSLHGGRGGPHGVSGKVTAVNGTTLTVLGPGGQSYTVNAASAMVKKLATGSLADVAVGDTIGVHGDRSGTTVTATTIMDDLPSPPTKTK